MKPVGFLDAHGMNLPPFYWRDQAFGAPLSTRAFVVRGVWLLAALALAGCDQLGIETPQKAAESKAAEAKAVGSACRHAMRAIEDCYTLNPKADKSAVFGGWREMDEYMRENKLDGIAPVVPRPAPQAASKASAPASEGDDAEEDAPDAHTQADKAGDKGVDKGADKHAKPKGH
jgi:hypothetical protein